MTIEEMHIAVNLGVQKIASFQVDNLLPQEIDHELNGAMESFIKQRYSPLGNKYQRGFEQSQKRIDDLRALLVDARLKCFYYGESITGFFTDRAPLPNDYMFLVNAMSDSFYKCDGTVGYNISHFDYYVANVSLTPPNAGWILTQMNSAGAVLIQNSNGMDLQHLLDVENYTEGLQDVISPAVSDPMYPSETSPFLNSPQNPPYDMNTLAASELTPVSNSNTLTMLLTDTINWGANVTAVWTNPLNAADTVNVEHTLGSLQELEIRTYSGLGTRQREMMSYVQHDDLYQLMGDPFNSPTYDRIKYTIQENFIDVHSDETFFTTFVNIKYIRRPIPMDITLGRGCELAPHTHDEIVEMAVQSILEAISDPRYNSQSREVLESE